MSAKFHCRILRETEAGLQIRQDVENRAVVQTWIPRGQCIHISKRPDGSSEIPATITCEDWIIEEKGIIENG